MSRPNISNLFKLLLLVTISCSNSVEAQNSRPNQVARQQCEDLSLDTSSMGPVRNQQSTEWCFAYAAADLFSYEVGAPVSAIAAGMRHFENQLAKTNPQTFDERARIIDQGGSVREVAHSHGNQSLCLESSVSSEPLIQSLAQRAPTINEKLDLRSLLLNSLETKPTEIVCRQTTNHLASLFNLRREIVAQSMRIPRTDRSTLWREMLQIACRPPARTPPYSKLTGISRGRLERSNSSMTDLLNQVLDSRKPISIIYDFSQVTEPRRSEPSPHVSVVVARRWRGNTCEFQVRNSMGKNCDNIPNCDPNTGMFWISANQANSLVTHAEYFTP